MAFTPAKGLWTLARSEVSNALKVDRPAGKSIWFTPRFGLIPPKAAVGQGPPLHKSAPEVRPRPAKSAILKGRPAIVVRGLGPPGHGAAIPASMLVTPQSVNVALIAF